MCVSVKRQCEEKEQRLAVLEESLSSAQREVTELRSCLREVERSRLEARRELQELRRQVSHTYPHISETLCLFFYTYWFTLPAVENSNLTRALSSCYPLDLTRKNSRPGLRHIVELVLRSITPSGEGTGWREGTEREGGG